MLAFSEFEATQFDKTSVLYSKSRVSHKSPRKRQGEGEERRGERREERGEETANRTERTRPRLLGIGFSLTQPSVASSIRTAIEDASLSFFFYSPFASAGVTHKVQDKDRQNLKQVSILSKEVFEFSFSFFLFSISCSIKGSSFGVGGGRGLGYIEDSSVLSLNPFLKLG